LGGEKKEANESEFPMFCPAKITRTFLLEETAAISVDFVVLTGGACGMAIAGMAAYANQIGQVSDAVAAGAQHREQRPAWAYAPHDSAVHSEFTLMLAELSDSDLSILAAWGNDLSTQGNLITNADAAKMFDDFNNAITAAYAERGASRPTATYYDSYDVQRVSSLLGFDQNALAAG